MFRRSSRLRSFALCLALAGVLLRGLIPTGFMPGWTQASADGEGRSWLMICPAGDLQTLLAHSSHHHHHHHENGAAGGADHGSHRIAEAHLSCPFAAATTPALPVSLTSPALPAGSPVLAGAVLPKRFIPASTRRLPPPRGPPSPDVVSS